MASTKFINECKNGAYKNRLGRLIFDDKTLTEKDDLISIETTSSIYTNGKIIGSINITNSKVELLESTDLINKSYSLEVGILFEDETTEYVGLGEYTCLSPKMDETSGITTIEESNVLTNIENNYKCGITSWTNVTIKDILIDICNSLGLTLKNTTFLNDDFIVEGNPFVNGEKIREPLSDIAEIACSWVDIDVSTKQLELCWFDSDVVETFDKSQYSKLECGKIYGPVNSVVIKESQIDGENVALEDNESIGTYGETQICISDNYYLNTQEKRQSVIDNIYNRLLGFKYAEYTLISYYGKPFIKVGNKVLIQCDDGSYIESYVLNNTFKYDGTFYSKIEAPALSKEETTRKHNNLTLKELLSNTQISVDKFNKRINALVSETSNINERVVTLGLSLEGINTTVSNLNSEAETIAKINISLEEIKNSIGSITDTTVSGQGIGIINIQNVLASELLYLQIYPTFNDLSYSYLEADDYLEEDDYLMSRDVLFTKEDGSYFRFTLPCDLLYLNKDVYDEFFLSLETEEMYVIHRVGINEQGQKYALAEANTEYFTYQPIEIDEGNYTIKMMSYEDGYIYIRALAKNMETSQFVTRIENNNSITQLRNSLTLEVNEKLTLVNNDIEEIIGKLELKIGSDENDKIVSMLNASADIIALKSDRFSLDSTYLKITKSGELTCTNANITGKNGLSFYDEKTKSTVKMQISTKTYEFYNFSWDNNRHLLTPMVGNASHNTFSITGTELFYFGRSYFEDVSAGLASLTDANIHLAKAWSLYFLDAVGSDLTVYGDFSQASDRRLKEKIDTLDDYSDFILNIKPIKYNYKSTKKEALGFVAQDVIKELENRNLPTTIVHEDNAGYYTLNYTGIIPMMVQTIQKLNNKIEDIKKKAGI